MRQRASAPFHALSCAVSFAVLFAASATLALAACSSGEQAAPWSATTAPSASPSTDRTFVTIVPTTTSSSLTTTTAGEQVPTSTTSVAVVTEPSTTIEETTTTVFVSIKAQVEVDFLEDRQRRLDCAYDPATCDYQSFAIAGSPVDISTRAKFDERLQANLRAVHGHGDVKIRVENVEPGPVSFVTACIYDTVVIFDIANPDDPNDDIIFNEDVGSRRTRFEMRQDDLHSRWFLYDGIDIEVLQGGDLCEF